jgi:hypothetical protein
MNEARNQRRPAGGDPPKLKRSNTRRRNRIIIASVFLIVLLFLILLPSGIDLILNNYIKPQFIESFLHANPGSSLSLGEAHYNIWSNRLSVDSIRIERMDSAETTLVSTIQGISVMEPGLRFLFPGDSDLNRLEGTTVVMSGFDCSFPRTEYRLACESFTVSFRDSIVEALRFLLKPDISDKEFFGMSAFRRTRFLVRLPEVRLTGFAVFDFLRGDSLAVRSIEAPGFLLDAVIDKSKPPRDPGEPADLPNVQLGRLPFPVRIDNLRLSDGEIVYGEEFRRRPGRAVLTFSDATIEAWDVSNKGGQAKDRRTRVAASALFAEGAILRIGLEGPIWSDKFQMRAVGSLGPMEISRLNPWTTISDGLRIELGKSNNAEFAINFREDSATGTVRVVYKDLAVTSLDPQAQTDEGIEDRFETFWLNEVQLRTENIPDGSGEMKIGQAAYRKKPHDTFLSYLWFSVRSGLGDTIGF